MEQKSFVLINKGMRRDITISKVGETAAFDNRNIRITATDKDTLLSVTNERGNKKIENLEFEGTLIGYGVLNNYLILFTAEGEVSRIYRVEYSGGSFRSILIFSGDLKFSDDYPIETIVNYETEDIQKIYWLDGKNVLRYLNFSDTYLKSHLTAGELYNTPVFDFKDDTTWFDSNRPSTSLLSVTIEKDFSGVARPNGTAQYFISYYNKNGQQTGIVWSSPLVYLSPADRGGAADQTNTCVVTLSMSGLDTTFDYVRLYQIVRTTQDGQVVAYLVGESSVQSGKAIVVDNGTHLETVDPTSFLYLGSVDVIAGTMTHKDNVLFLGNLKSVGNAGIDELETAIKQNAFILSGDKFAYEVDWESSIVSFQYSNTIDLSKAESHLPYVTATGYYPYENQLKYTNAQISTFKGGEKYRFALRFIRNNGTMSKSFWIGDKVNPYYPAMKTLDNISRVIAVCYIPNAIIEAATASGFSSVQLMIAAATYADRSVQAQGIVSPTMFNLYDRVSGRAFAQSSWLYRANGGDNYLNHLGCLASSEKHNSELQCNWWNDVNNPPYPLYTLGKNGLFENVPIGFDEQISHVAITVTVTAYSYPICSFNGILQVEYYTSETENAPVKTYTRGLGEIGFWDRQRAKKKVVTDWLKAYDDANIPVALRTTTDDMYKLLDAAQDDMISVYFYSKPGTATYKLEKTPLNYSSLDKSSLYAKYNREYFFEDNNIITLNSPEITYESVNLDKNSGLRFRIVGAASITGNISDYTVETSDAKFLGDNVMALNFSHQNLSNEAYGLLSWPLYVEKGYKKKDDTYETVDKPFYYMTYMWQKAGSIPEYGDSELMWSSLTKKRIANLRFSMYTVFNNYKHNTWDVQPDDVRQVNSLSSGIFELQRDKTKVPYISNVDTVVSVPEDVEYPVYFSENAAQPDSTFELKSEKSVSTPVRMTYNSNPHAVISLPSKNNVDTILPYLYDSDKFVLGNDNHSKDFYTPWMGTDYSGKRLMYRTVSDKQVSELSVGSYGQFKSYYLDENNSTFFGVSVIDEPLYYLRQAIQSKSLNREIFAVLNVGQDTSKQYLVDVSNMQTDTTSVTVELVQEYSVTTALQITVESALPIDMFTVTADVTTEAATTTSFTTTALVKGATKGKAIYKTPLITYNTESVVLKVVVHYAVEYKYGDKVVTLDDMSFDTKVTAGNSNTTTGTKYIIIEKVSYINPETNSKPIEFVNIASDPNYIDTLEADHVMTRGEIYSTFYKMPNQSKYLLDSYNLIPDSRGHLLVGELYKDYDALAEENIALDTRYGGISESAVEACTFITAGPRTKLSDQQSIEQYAKTTVNCSDLADYLMRLSTFDDKQFTLRLNGKNGVLEEIDLSDLRLLTPSTCYPSSQHHVSTLSVEQYEDGTWHSKITELPDEMLDNIKTDSNYKIAVLRWGYARRGKFRTFMSDKGVMRSSHTTRQSKKSTDGSDVGKENQYRLCRGGLKFRVIGMDLLQSKKSTEQLKLHSCTWTTAGERRFMDYNNCTLITSYADSIVLPTLRKKCVSVHGHYRNKAKDGIRDLYIGLMHRENGRWVLCSNAYKVRGTNTAKNKIWEFDQTNIVRTAEEDLKKIKP